YDADTKRVERIRARCVSVLEARRPEAAMPPRPPAWRSWLEPAVAVAVGAVYLAEAVTRALALYR
ncbi:MAG TPA: hypothetical protein VLF95_01990, partial [Vicinamibacteria bacterium]|nr:hypothetical protein [Vicinamibacteria bacterium]